MIFLGEFPFVDERTSLLEITWSITSPRRLPVWLTCKFSSPATFLQKEKTLQYNVYSPICPQIKARLKGTSNLICAKFSWFSIQFFLKIVFLIIFVKIPVLGFVSSWLYIRCVQSISCVLSIFSSYLHSFSLVYLVFSKFFFILLIFF